MVLYCMELLGMGVKLCVGVVMPVCVFVLCFAISTNLLYCDDKLVSVAKLPYGTGIKKFCI